MSEPIGAVPAEVESIFREFAANQITLEPAQKRLRATAEDLGWSWLGLTSRQSFNRTSAAMLGAWGYAQYCELREAELRDQSLALWVFKADPDCRDVHLELDGLALPSDHAFWASFAPPLSWECRCYIAGARSGAAAQRLGADLDKPIPDWAEDASDPVTIACIDLPWRQRPLSLRAMLDAVRTGNGPP